MGIIISMRCQEGYQIYENSIQVQTALLQSSLQHWFANELFTWNWWIKIVVLLVLIWVWLKFVDRKRLHDLVLFPVLFTLTYQRFKPWKLFIISNTILAALLSYPGEIVARGFIIIKNFNGIIFIQSRFIFALRCFANGLLVK